MKLWALWTDENRYPEYSHMAIVRAASEGEARALASERNVGRSYILWGDLIHTHCHELVADGEEEIICDLGGYDG